MPVIRGFVYGAPICLLAWAALIFAVLNLV